MRGLAALKLISWRTAAVCAALAAFSLGATCAQQRRTGDAEAAARAVAEAGPENSYEAHAALFTEERFPSAKTCSTCHPTQYKEWSVSQHAYAQISPVFNAMQGTINKRTSGTFGDFCIRCHTPVGMSLNEPTFTSNLNRHPVSNEGITCIVCHRVDRAYGKVSGRRALNEGDLLFPVFGPKGGAELARAIESPEYDLSTTKEGIGRPVHVKAERFFQLIDSSFCGACHDVTLPNGFRLEEAFSEYKASPAAAKGITCQQCHMSTDQGVPAGFEQLPAAVVGGVPTRVREHANHMFVGPDYPIVHPGIFPHNPRAAKFASTKEWLSFDYKAGWGTDAFENNVSDDYDFPARWRSIDDRYDAREILADQLALIEEARRKRLALLRHGYKLSDIVVEESGAQGIRFKVKVENGTEGHNVPTGFTAERLVWLRVTVRDSRGREVFVSGDYDPNGDVRDGHSFYVHNGELPPDDQLFSLQSKFLTTNVRGSEREQILAVNYSVDALPFLRPETNSSVLTGRPRDARIHKQGIEPGGARWAEYRVSAEQLTGAGPYEATVELVAAMVPVNLVHEIKEVGFDYGMSPREVADAVVAGHLVLWERKLALNVE